MDRFTGVPRPVASKLDHWVERVRPGERLDVVILSECIWGATTHWTGKRTFKCTEKEGTCNGCKKKLPVRDKFAVHVYDMIRREKYFVELTPRAARLLDAQVPQDQLLRGVKISLSRSGLAPNGRLNVRVTGTLDHMERFPESQDPERAFVFLWSHRH
jgi:hypothetical protein